MLGFLDFFLDFRGIVGIFSGFVGNFLDMAPRYTSGLRKSFLFPLAHHLLTSYHHSFWTLSAKGWFLFFDNGPFFATFCLWASWTSMVNEHSYTEALRIVSFLFFFQNLFSKPLVSKIYIICTFSFFGIKLKDTLFLFWNTSNNQTSTCVTDSPKLCIETVKKWPPLARRIFRRGRNGANETRPKEPNHHLLPLLKTHFEYLYICIFLVALFSQKRIKLKCFFLFLQMITKHSKKTFNTLSKHVLCYYH